MWLNQDDDHHSHGVEDDDDLNEEGDDDDRWLNQHGKFPFIFISNSFKISVFF